MAYCLDLFKTISVFVFSIQVIFGAFRWIYENFIGPRLLGPKNLRQYGKWALITGATDGIGKQFAKSVRKAATKDQFRDFSVSRVLAARGFNIILVSRTPIKLKHIAEEIVESFHVQTKVIAVNFTRGPEIYDQIKQQIAGIEIGILINNVGMFYPAPDRFLDIPDRSKVVQDIISCNITSVPMMCSLILPQMVERKYGLILNVSSISSGIPCPNLTVYSASKAFIAKFSSDLAAEYESHGITIQALITGSVGTNMTKVKGGTFAVPTTQQYVESALQFVGYSRLTNGFLPHSLMQFFIQFLNFVAPSFAEKVMLKRFKTSRQRILKPTPPCFFQKQSNKVTVSTTVIITADLS